MKTIIRIKDGDEVMILKDPYYCFDQCHYLIFFAGYEYNKRVGMSQPREIIHLTRKKWKRSTVHELKIK